MSTTPLNMAIIPTYRFYVTHHTITIEVFPLNFNATSLIDQFEGNNIFYRRKFNGTLLFGTNSTVIDVGGVEQNRMDDWALFWLMESYYPCERIDLTITKTVNGIVGVPPYWEGYFSTTDGKFDIDKCTFEVTPLADDDYVDILKEADVQYNILDVGPEVSRSCCPDKCLRS